MKVNKVELQTALEKVKPGLANKEFIEQSTSFTFVGDRVVTYNDEISISHPVKGLNVTGAIKAQALYAFLSKVDKDEIDIDWEDKQVLIKAGRAKAGFIFEHEVKLPIKEEIGEIADWVPLPEGFVDALKFCYPCASRDMSRPIITCVHVSGRTIEASDTYQIIKFDLADEVPAESFLIPAYSVKELVKYPIKEMSRNNSWVHFRTEDGTVFSSRLIEGEFPDTARFFDVAGVPFTFPDKIVDGLQRAEIFTRNDLGSHEIPTIAIRLGGGRIVLKSKNDFGWFKEQVKVSEYEGDAFTFHIGTDFLLKLFEKTYTCIIGGDRIKFSGDNWLHVVSMRADEEKGGK
ncbi:MAG: hypothetical protein M0R74_15770 [Dehalococcoidia bacterium]|nr:hypothetical protein [Dehalococcoidia bacterium]